LLNHCAGEGEGWWASTRAKARIVEILELQLIYRSAVILIETSVSQLVQLGNLTTSFP
jgi:hypothetical protein